MATVVHPPLKELLQMMDRTFRRHPDPGLDWETILADEDRPDDDEDGDEGFCPGADDEEDD